MQITPAIRACLARMSYTDIFALRFATEGAPPGLIPSHARQSCLACENEQPLRKNILYLHVPFCASRCRYCPYYSHGHAPDLIKSYLEAMTTGVQRNTTAIPPVSKPARDMSSFGFYS